jgi:hypothetical protein
VTHLPEHTAVPKIESLTLLFEMTSFEKKCAKLSVFGNAVCSGKYTIE